MAKKATGKNPKRPVMRKGMPGKPGTHMTGGKGHKGC